MLDKKRLEEINFPYEEVREVQDDLILSVQNALEKGKNLIVHAPTGLGKTAATLAPAVSYAVKNKKTVFFLTSRHTQHFIAVDTIKEMKKKFGLKVLGTDIIGKKWMCVQPGSRLLRTGEFADYCRAVREEGKCEFYTNVRDNSKVSVRAKAAIDELEPFNPMHTEDIINHCKNKKLCPYEVSMLIAKKSSVIITDYYYLFHPQIMQSFLAKLDKEIEDSIIIIDEGHNLHSRIRDLATEKISTNTLLGAVREAKKYGYDEALEWLVAIQDVLNEMSKSMKHNEEKLVDKKKLVDKINKIRDYDSLTAELSFIADEVRSMKKRSYIGSVARFLEAWKGPDHAFTRIITMRDNVTTISYRCLDASILAGDIINSAHSTIIMSGTLTPISMFRDLLGIENAVEKKYESPFPSQNRLNLIVPLTTTKYAARSNAQYKEIAKVLGRILDAIPGNALVFFPSYFLRDSVNSFLECRKTIMIEENRMTKEDKKELLDKFKEYKDVGAALLGVVSGSFGEGIDLPGDLLKGVVIVGLPLQVPDMETKQLINYYDKKFGRGWDYGYVFPAFNKILQNAGRCIRSSKDKGVVVFLDERYVWPQYTRCFPEDSDLEASKKPEERIKEFFNSI